MSRDLWPGIEARLETTVLPLAGAAADTVERQPIAASAGTSVLPGLTWRRLAVAAVALVTLSAGTTWTLARRAPAGGGAPETALASATGGTDGAPPLLDDGPRSQRLADVVPRQGGATGNGVSGGGTPQDSAAEANRNTGRGTPPSLTGEPLTGGARAVVAANAPASGTPRPTTEPERARVGGAPVRLAADGARVVALDTLYGREIALLRTVAEQQLVQLDSSTVAVVRRNLDIIDRAILESRAALANDPNSGFLLDQLDRAYERKVDLLRRLALL